MNKFLFFEKNLRFLLNFGALTPNLFLRLFPAPQVSEIILIESSKTTQNALIERLRNETTKVFHENQSIRILFEFNSFFQNCFWNLFSTSGLSEICKIRNVWKLLSKFSRKTLIPFSERSCWSLKPSFCKKNYPSEFVTHSFSD
jgi:hypothetical protein